MINAHLYSWQTVKCHSVSVLFLHKPITGIYKLLRGRRRNMEVLSNTASTAIKFKYSKMVLKQVQVEYKQKVPKAYYVTVD